MKEKTILCPKCAGYVMKYDGKRTSDLYGRCKNCYKQVIYRTNTGKVEVRNIPPRSTSSGMRLT